MTGARDLPIRIAACLLLLTSAEESCLDGLPEPEAAEVEPVHLLQIGVLQKMSAEERAKVLLKPFQDFMPGSLAQWKTDKWPLANVSLLGSAAVRRHCGADACAQPLAKLEPAGPRRTYVFIMGVEGAGHHAVCPLLDNIMKKTGFEVHVAKINMFGREKILPFPDWKKSFLAEMQSWCPRGVCLNCLDSFPYERPIEASAAPDFSRMAALHEDGSIDLRVVSIMRNVSDSVFSALRRFPSDPVQAVAGTRHFLMEVVRNTDAWSRTHCERLATLRYENLVHDARDVTPGLVRALGLGGDHDGKAALTQALSVADTFEKATVHKSHGSQYRDHDPELYDKVSSWLTEREAFLWPELKELWCK